MEVLALRMELSPEKGRDAVFVAWAEWFWGKGFATVRMSRSISEK